MSVWWLTIGGGAPQTVPEIVEAEIIDVSIEVEIFIEVEIDPILLPS